jgi:hypothetical protein
VGTHPSAKLQQLLGGGEVTQADAPMKGCPAVSVLVIHHGAWRGSIVIVTTTIT